MGAGNEFNDLVCMTWRKTSKMMKYKFWYPVALNAFRKMETW